MGVPGLWDLIRPAAVRTSLSELGRDGFLANRNNDRAFTIGVDASIWIFHAQQTHAGSNPFERTLFHKLCALLQQPIMVVFVFDGPAKPSLKRGQKVAGRFGVTDSHSRRFKDLLDICGIEWWNAPGEAEAELAVMNRQGKIDAVLSDDVDALVFGASCLLRNNSPTLSGAQASSTQSNSTRSELRHYEVFRMRDICSEWARDESALVTDEDCRMAMVLIAILSGGDYAPEGTCRIGPTKAIGLARAGHAAFLKLYLTDQGKFYHRLGDVHANMVEELRTNSSGFVGKRYKEDARRFASMEPEDIFQELPLESYLRPSTSPANEPSQGWPGFGEGERTTGRGKARNNGGLDLEGMARACETFFEWGTRDIVCKKFATPSVNLLGAEIVAEARKRARAAASSKSVLVSHTTMEGSRRISGPSGRLTSYFSQSVTKTTASSQVVGPDAIPEHFVKLHSSRPSPTCQDITEYRLAFKPEPYLRRVRQAMDGTRVDPSALPTEDRVELGLVESGERADTTVKDELRIWVPEYLIRHAWPALLDDYEAELAAKAQKKSTPKKKKAAPKKIATAAGDPDVFRSYFVRLPPMQSTAEGVVPTGRSLQQRNETLSPLSSRRSNRAATRKGTARELTPTSSSPVRNADLATSPEAEKRSRSLLSSSSSNWSESSETAPSSHPSPTKKRAPRRVQPSSPSPARTSSSTSAGSSCEPIDLTVSSDEETPTATRVLQSSTAMNARKSPSPTLAPCSPTAATCSPTEALYSPSRRISSPTRSQKPPSPSPPPKVTISSATTYKSQSLLTSMIVARSRPKAAPRPAPIRKPRYVFYEDDDGEEHIDFTQQS